MENLRKATKADIKAGTTLIMSEGWEYTLLSEYMDGIWEARGPGGDKLIYTYEIETYKVKM